MSDARQNEFFSAAKNGNLKLVAQLLKEGENINQCDYGGGTALHFASLKGQTKMVEYLVRNGADVKAYTEMWGHAPIHWAAHDNKVEVLEFLIKFHRSHNVSIDLKSNSGDTPLILAAHDGHLPAVKLLVENGANLHCRGMEDRTAVQWAAKKRQTAIVEYLVSCGADIETRPKKHKSVMEIGSKLPAIQEAIERGLASLLAKKEKGLPIIDIRPVYFWDNDAFEFNDENKSVSPSGSGASLSSSSATQPPLVHAPSMSVQRHYGYGGGTENSYSSDEERAGVVGAVGAAAGDPSALGDYADDPSLMMDSGPSAHFSSSDEDEDDDEEDEDDDDNANKAKAADAGAGAAGDKTPRAGTAEAAAAIAATSAATSSVQPAGDAAPAPSTS